MTGDGIKALGDHCQSLIDLDLTGVPFVNDVSLIHLIKLNPNIQTLGFAESSLSDQVILTISQTLDEKVGTNTSYIIAFIITTSDNFGIILYFL